MLFLQYITPTVRDSVKLNEGWMFYIFILILGILAVVKWNYAKNFKELFTAVVNIRLLREILREEIILTSRASQLLNVLAFSSMAMFLYLSFSFLEYKLFGLEIYGIWYFTLILCCLVGLYFVKIIGLFLIKILFEGDFSLIEYEFNYGLLVKLIGVVLIPVSLIMAYYATESQQLWMYSGFVVVVLSVLWRWIRGVHNAVKSKISIVYIILYLCTLEFLPVAVMLKVLIGA